MKPRLKKRGSKWYCAGAECWGVANTPYLAWVNWASSFKWQQLLLTDIISGEQPNEAQQG